MVRPSLSLCPILAVLLVLPTGQAAAQSDWILPPQPTPVEILFSISPFDILRPVGYHPFWGGDEASDRGYVVRHNWDFVRPFNPPATFAAEDYGLDALFELNWGPIVSKVLPVTLFSVNKGFTNSSTGETISDGDLLSTTGKIVARNKDLLARFGAMPIVPDMGLDAVFIPYYLPSPTAADALVAMPEIWFSFDKDRLWSGTQGGWLSHGDLLSSRGYVVATNAQLLRNFQPIVMTASPLPPDFGLDAVYVPYYRCWYADTAASLAATSVAFPREIWFSVKKGFTDKRGFTVSDGDLLSTTGKIVRTNAQLLEAFFVYIDVPQLENYGLDAVHIRGRKIVITYPAMDATLAKVANNQVRLVFDGQVPLPAGAAVRVTSLSDGQDVTAAFTVQTAATNEAGDSLVLAERGAALAATGRYRIEPAEGLPVEPFQLEIGKLPGDVDGSGGVDVMDLLSVGATWGLATGDNGYDPTCDFNGDSAVDVVDLMILADSWGR